MQFDEEFFSFLFRHLFLPPKLPQSSENELPGLESRLLGVIHGVLVEFLRSCPPSSLPGWQVALDMLKTWMAMDIAEGISKSTLEQAFAAIFSKSKTISYLMRTMNKRNLTNFARGHCLSYPSSKLRGDLCLQ